MSTRLWCTGRIAPLSPTGHLLNKATPSRLEEIADLLNTQKQTQRITQNEKKEEYVTIERIRQNLRKKDLSKMKISNLPDKGFKVMVVKILTRLRGKVD